VLKNSAPLYVFYPFLHPFKNIFMKRIFIVAAAAAVGFVACNRDYKIKSEKISLQKNTGADFASVDTTAVSLEDITLAAPPPPKQQPGDTNQQKEKSPSPKTPESKPDWNKKIIKTANINIETKKYADFSKKITDAVNRFGGYIAEEQQSETEYKIENTVTLKVPVDQFQNAIDFITNGDDKINEKKITSEDVTSQYVDTRSRLEAKRAARQRYLQLLQQTKNMEEILQVQNEIDAIQEEMESAAGRINYLVNASAMSTIHLTYYQVLNATAVEDETPGFFKQVGHAFTTGWKGVVEVLVGLIYLWPLWIFIGSGVWLWKRFGVNKKKQAVVRS
jgi:flagellar biosynthesis chaperone FliJ